MNVISWIISSAHKTGCSIVEFPPGISSIEDVPPKIKTDDRGPPRKAHSQLLGPQLAHEPCVWFAAHVASHRRSGACISLVIQEGLQAHSEEVGQIRTTIVYVCSLIQALPPFLIITKEPQTKACRLKGGLDHTIHMQSASKDVGPLTWVKIILKLYRLQAQINAGGIQGCEGAWPCPYPLGSSLACPLSCPFGVDHEQVREVRGTISTAGS